MTLVLARAETSGPRVRLYCEMFPSLLIGAPSKNHSGRRRIPVLPELVGRGDDVTRCLNAGSRYLSKRSVAVFHFLLHFALAANSGEVRHRLSGPAGPGSEFSLNLLEFARFGKPNRR